MNDSIQVCDLHKSFRNGEVVTPVLKGVDLNIGAGEMFFIVGPSGCGKTTLISLLCGTLRADDGSINVLGHNLRAMGESRVTRFRARNVGFVFQQFNLIPTLSVVENIAVPLRLQGKSPREARRAAAAMLERVGLAEKVREKTTRLSGGQQQRVAIARALVHQPALIVCDEPTSALDSETGGQVMNLLTPQSGDDGRIVIVVTHDPRIYHHADRIAEMEDGVIRRTLSRTEANEAFGFNHQTTHS
jgi:putative ABC transport system ATP-binding protein